MNWFGLKVFGLNWLKWCILKQMEETAGSWILSKSKSSDDTEPAEFGLKEAPAAHIDVMSTRGKSGNIVLKVR